ncbi:MAG: glycoside hydrolase family 2 TIM barrel-domain containing protein [Clostridium sp.]|uniref:glycoside hydrolase family 2 TIM barrel-domain containing protein n=1 Tax=Clostridium sp. TaxID=1506 RepID=UPI003D6D2068
MNHFQKFHTKNDWKNLNVTSINREESHAPWGAYENASQALSCDRTLSSWTNSLDGIWKFAYYTKPTKTESFFETNYNHENWKDINVPGNWELQGFGDPIYTNTLLPWDYYSKDKQIIHPKAKTASRGLPNPPYIPEENPTGCYYREFNISSEWLESEIFIHFKGVETAYYLWINGKEVGYSQDSKLPSEFNITDFIKQGKNIISVQVMRFAESTYLEDQDYWYLSGIFRSVSLYAKPKTRIVDFKIDALPNLYYGFGEVKADVTINRFNGFADYKVRLDVFTIENHLLSSKISEINSQGAYRSYETPTSNTARFNIKVEDIKQWTPETPTLYKVVITLLSPSNKEVDFESCKIGFKKIEIVDGVILLNGNRLIVRGVNRHEHEAYGGRSVTFKHMVEEIKLMKRLNINSVRTCHYPDDPIWYDLCDEYGILLICECNLETHGVFGALSHNPAWGTNFLERAIRMVLTHKNHPSIYSWSLGNESGVGANHAGMAGWIREYDPSRLCQYEAGEPGKNISDVRGNMYATQKNILQMLTDASDIRPIVLVEYLYQIRNSGGGMYKFYDLVENYKRFQGGYVWDWQDKCLIAKTSDGTQFFGYGGDFSESIVDWECPGFMTNNGIVLPDLTPKPIALEVKQIYCPIIFEELSQENTWISEKNMGCFTIKNRNIVLDTNQYDVTFSVRENGYIIETGLFELPYLKAGEAAEATFTDNINKKPNCEYTVEFIVKYVKESAYATAGYEIGCYQFRLASGVYEYELKKITETKIVENKVSIENHMDIIKIIGSDFTTSFDKTTGLIFSHVKNDCEYLNLGPKECLTRPLTGIDAGDGWGRSSIWEEFDSKNVITTLKKISVQPLGTTKAIIEVVREIKFSANHFGIIVVTNYTVNGDGQIKVQTIFNIDPSLKDLPRVGLELIIPEHFDTIEYFGLGPVENYSDRKHSAKLGVFQNSVEGEHFPFIPPSENGGHEQTRWITLINGNGRIIKITALVPFHFDVHYNTIEDYKNAKHEHELIRRNESYLHIDAAHSGIGSDMGWSTMLVESEQVKAQNYILEFTISFE